MTIFFLERFYKKAEENMLAINPFISNIRNINLLRPQQNKVLQQPQQKYPNLRPLAHDCVSFTSSKKLNRSLLEAFDNKEACIDVHKNADVAEADLKKTLKNSLDDLIATEENPTGPISTITTRIKTPNSIREKVASELSHAITSNDQTGVFNPNSRTNIKKVCGDIVGARIILGNQEQKQTGKIIDELIDLVLNGELNIEGIASYRPEKLDPKWEYFEKDDLKRLVDAVNENRKIKGKTPIELKEEAKKTGYMALHLDIDLADYEYKAKNNGYKGEIQIVGQDISRLKEVEDFCYKIRFDKDIKSGHVAYAPFTKYFTKHIGDEKFPKLADDFVEYTKRAYMFQRKKEPDGIFDKRKKRDISLPTIEQCHMSGKIPPELDFNVLSKIKYHCDKLYDLTNDETV